MRAALLVIALIAAAAAILFTRSDKTPGPPMRDFEAYYAGGTVWNAGDDPYSQAIWQVERTLPGVGIARYEALPFVAPPAVLPAFSLMAKLPFGAANALWRGLLIAAIGGLALLTLRLARIPVTAASLALMALAAIGFGPLTSALALGQLALPAALFTALALLFPASALFAWIQPNLGIALISQAFTRRGMWLFAASAALFAMICALVVTLPGLAHYLDVVHRHSLAERFSAIQLTPAAIASGFGAPSETATAIGLAVAVLVAGCWLLAMRGSMDAVARFCMTCVLLPFVMPFFHEHDLALVFVPAALYAIRCESRVWPLAACGTLAAGTNWLDLAQRPDAAPQTLLLITALGCALLALRERIDMRMLLAPGSVLVLIALAAVLARAHPAPVWPDAIRALPPEMASMDVASAWNVQQRASGLLEQEPVWALLRGCSLFGCALIATAIARSSKSTADSRSPSPAPA